MICLRVRHRVSTSHIVPLYHGNQGAIGRRASLTASRGNAAPRKNAGVGKGHSGALL